MKIKKVTVLLSSLVLSTTMLVGCSNAKTDNKKAEGTDKTNHIYKIDETADADGLNIVFNKVQMLKAEDKKTDVVQFQFKLKNTTVEKKGFTAIELEVKNADNKTLEVYPGENYGKEISGGKSDSGTGYFTSKGKGPYTVKYTDAATNKVITWKLNIEK